MKKKNIAIILARSGSKGLKNKNQLKFHGKPLISYTIDAIKNANLFDEIVLSTDSKKLAKIALKEGIKVPFLRPKHLSKDNSKAKDAIKHTLEFYKKRGITFDYVLYAFPTTPLKQSKDIIKSYKLMLKKRANMVISVCENDKPKEWVNNIGKNLSLKNFINRKGLNKNRQDFKKNYRINGSIYFGKWNIFYHQKYWFGNKTYAYIMPKERSIDIDNIIDFELAKIMFKKKKILQHG